MRASIHLLNGTLFAVPELSCDLFFGSRPNDNHILHEGLPIIYTAELVTEGQIVEIEINYSTDIPTAIITKYVIDYDESI